ncbi:MAG TPA: 16S rRNA (cytosine(1402)-N(4))-methyltransferase RsmH [Nitrospirae bacterium]|nr:ribosomal RNA small subunit methyltransferase H [bacterium BMS3Bbin05]HDH00576.1 16S rRNA (cytosine(1402)-N(4))-methyltransferase RsmH [Nitrospirota bacterium]HDL20530.1 16S rRNA (cytosine(1402)-N(4))-methyltransferase RsmH [Nitrospirota bacterium]HDO21847.1 16S rRNA (cytosine(1402)-N(4))-methyltransferase RsmH [Nitrospirota bacterium]HDZ87162.1 16S rRNA (cytosine(1402)-N(4))-methyltransferase RsmH [Nitrospirota bacterium]
MIQHEPVLLREVLEMLDVKENGIYVDATAGGGGHSREILGRLSDRGVLVCADRDDDAIGRLTRLFDDHRVVMKKTTFSDIYEDVMSAGFDNVDGILFDLGVSMHQLKDKDRGFSFDSDVRLDMRMDASLALTAWDVVNKYPQREIERILREYSDERFFRRIARAIVNCRRKKTIDTCRDLADIVVRAYGRRGKIHPATRTFQAIRIAVNNELEELNDGLRNAVKLLKSGGRLCVISYHSIEDRIVKNFIRDRSRDGILHALTKKPLTASSDEVRSNPAARSAKLRGAEKI